MARPGKNVSFPAWPTLFQYLPFIVFFWPIGVGYSLFSISTIFLLISGFQPIHFLIWIANLLLAGLLMPWPVIGIMIILGITVALSLIKSCTSLSLMSCLAEICTLEFKIIYGILLFLCLLVILYKHHQEKLRLQKKQTYQEKLLKAHDQERLQALQYQAYYKKTLSAHKDHLQFIKKALYILTKNHPEETKTVQKALEQCDAYIDFQKKSLLQTMDFVQLTVEQITVDTLLTYVATSLQSIVRQPPVSFCVTTQHTHIACDVHKITELLVTSMRTLYQAEKPVAPLVLAVQDTSLWYQLKAIPEQQYKKKLPAIGLVLTTGCPPMALQTFYQGNTEQTEFKVPHQIDELLQQKNEQVIDAHYGYYEKIRTAKGTQLLYVLPVNVRSIRAKVVDEIPLTGRGVLENAASLAAEKAFLDQLQPTPGLELAVAQEVIAYIKQVHQGQYRKSGDLFYIHPLTVASFVLTMTQDPDTIIAALLHDTVEDTPNFLPATETTQKYHLYFDSYTKMIFSDL